MPNDRFLITGALGCIGAWTVRNLVREETPVVVFDLASDPRRLKLIMSDDELARVTFVTGDITDLEALERALDDHAITRVIHLAALQIPFVRANPPLGARVNVVGTVNVFEAVARRRDRIGSLVYASSAAVYDAVDAGESGVVAHGAAGHPTTLYGVFKQANEGTARVYWQDARVASIGLRPYIVYGPGRDQGLTSSPTKAMVAAALGKPYHIPYGGRAAYQYADDVARTFIACARAPFQGAEIFNLGGSVATMGEIVAAIEAAAPEVRGLITFDDKPLPFPEAFDAAPLEQVIGALPFTPLAQAVADTIALFRERIAAGVMPDAV
ncbi:NAD-dependent epimerase/dehydratase family protein [Roseiflexus sp. RS-1]|uniref:NAD-dependent epimerase/dehydratase family protein n=1 Tax=Roseiflexus sp. (strain RS-1) TaxID=357808 RepID=UPI0000D7FF37|nr:NAD-dependent epimerase/dehydratase family protein [Roseiflexus sp. RS-1]ABQ88791.1 NAD-dependent epimerase/dehydratase [Roseiflexus sp. RS-1]